MTFKIALLIAVLRRAVELGLQDESTLIVYLIDQSRLEAIPESLAADSEWNQSVGYWEQVSNLAPDNIAEIASYDDDKLGELVRKFRCFVPGVNKVID